MTHRILFLLPFALLPVAQLACGDINSGPAPGENVFVLEGTTEGAALSAPEGEYRAALEWYALGESAAADCFASEEGAAQFACLSLATEAQASIADVAIEPVFPASFSLPLPALPPEDVLLDDDGARLALGRVFVYDDRDLDQTLDFTNFTDTNARDLVVGDSAPQYGTSNKTSFLIYREGPLHPFWNLLETFFGCDTLAPGFTVVELDGNTASCAMRRQGPMVVELSDALEMQLNGCRGTPTFTPSSDPFPATEPPAGAVISCNAVGDELSFHLDDGAFCNQASRQEYALEGCHNPELGCIFSPISDDYYDLRSTPPSWWPCEFEALPVTCANSGRFQGTLTLTDTGPQSVDVPIAVVPFDRSEDEIAEQGISIGVQFGPQETLILMNLIAYDLVSDGTAPTAAGETYVSTSSFGDFPMLFHVTRLTGDGGVRLVAPDEFPSIEVVSWDTSNCGESVLQITNYSAPETDGLSGFAIEGTLRGNFGYE